MNPLKRSALAIVLAAAAVAACGSSGARAEESQNGAADVLKALSNMAAKQVFTGTIVVKESASSTAKTSDTIATSMSTRSLNNTVSLTVTKGAVVANIAYEEKSRVESELRYQYHKVIGTKTEETTAGGTNNQDATVSVDLRSDGTYQINFGSGGVVGEYRMSETSQTICTDLRSDPTCRPATTSNSDSGKPPGQGRTGGSVDGRIDRAKPNVLVGSVTQRHELNDGSTMTRTVTWNLSR